MSDPNAPAAPEGNPYPSAPPAYQPPAYTQAPYGQSQYGSAPAYGGGYPAPAKTNTLAIVSLISSLVGMFLVPVIGSIVAVITGHISLSQIKKTGEQGRGLGLAGTIIGWVGVVLTILGIIAVIIFIGYVAANPQEFRTSS